MNQLIPRHQRTAVDRGDDLHAREQMAYAQFLAGMTFNNASLGYVHAMAHLPGWLLRPAPRGLQRRAAAPCPGLQHPGERHERRARGRSHCRIRQLTRDVAIPAGLAQLGIWADDFDVLAENALKDACGFTNPKQALPGPPSGPFYWLMDQWLFTSARGVGMICRAKKTVWMI